MKEVNENETTACNFPHWNERFFAFGEWQNMKSRLERKDDKKLYCPHTINDDKFNNGFK